MLKYILLCSVVLRCCYDAAETGEGGGRGGGGEGFSIGALRYISTHPFRRIHNTAKTEQSRAEKRGGKVERKR